MLNRIHSPQDCLSSLWDKSFLQERGIASFFLTEKNTFENTPLFDGIFRYLLIQKGTAQITITGLEYFLKPSCLVVLAPEYYCQFTEIGSDFQGSLLLVDKSYLDTLPASDKMYRHITKVMLQQRQVNLFNQQHNKATTSGCIRKYTYHSGKIKTDPSPPKTRNHTKCPGNLSSGTQQHLDRKSLELAR